MERAEQDTGGRFDGGIFSGQREILEENIPYRNSVGSGSIPQVQRTGVGGIPQVQQTGVGGIPQVQQTGVGGIPQVQQTGGGSIPQVQQTGIGGIPQVQRTGVGNIPQGQRNGIGSIPPGQPDSGGNVSRRPQNGSGFGDGAVQRQGNRPGQMGGTGGTQYRGLPPQCPENRYPCGCQTCPKGGQSNQQLFFLVAIITMGMLFLAFLATLFFLVCLISGRQAESEKKEVSSSYEARDSDAPFRQEEPESMAPDWQEKAEEAESGSHGEYYGEIRDAVRTDLSYSIKWENYEYEGNSDTVMIAIDYPVIEGEIPNIELLNDVIAEEIDYFEEYYAEYSKYMLPEEIFAVYSEGYVTYMDEEVMSVVFSENIYTDYWVDCGLYCVNIDMENGVILENSSILDVDDEFAIDFRTRCRVQNGDVGALEYLTDQEVAYYLTDGATGIIFFTPMGMEIGLNYGEDYLTVTYKDYKEYLLKY